MHSAVHAGLSSQVVWVVTNAFRQFSFTFRGLGEHLSVMLPEQPRFIEPATVIGYRLRTRGAWYTDSN